MQKGIVIKKLANLFWVQCNTNVFTCIARGKTKQNNIFVGDKVSFDNNCIELVEERKNLLKRPPLANLSQLIIVISPLPKPDFMMVDKLLLFCFVNDIKPIICVNKSDTESYTELEQYVKFAYKDVAKIICTSAKKDISSLKEVLPNNVSAFAGQSAVGKSALIKAILPQADAISGDLSEKIKRGKNTTRHSELYVIDDNSFIADSSGFSSLDETLIPIPYYELTYYYPDYVKLMDKCKFLPCSHINISDCEIKRQLQMNALDKDRYNRYCVLNKSLEQFWRKNHG